MPAYCTASDLIARFDERDIQQLVIDDSSDSTTVNVTMNARVDVALDDAEGEVIAALRKGGRYMVGQLELLTGTDLAYLKRIVCEIAMVHLLRRRPTFATETLEFYEKIRKGHIKDLQDGSAILTADEPAAQIAGAINNEGPSLVEWDELNLWRERTRYFPPRRYT